MMIYCYNFYLGIFYKISIRKHIISSEGNHERFLKLYDDKDIYYEQISSAYSYNILDLYYNEIIITKLL